MLKSYWSCCCFTNQGQEQVIRLKLVCEIIHPVDTFVVRDDASYWHYSHLIESLFIHRRPWRRPKHWSVMLEWLSPMLWVFSHDPKIFLLDLINITSFSSPVVFSSLPPLCAVPAAAASSLVNIHTIIWSEITPSLATAAARCGRRSLSPSPFRFTSISCATRPSTAGNTWIRSAFDSFGALYTITGLFAWCSFFEICLQWYQKLCTTCLNI